MDLEKVLMILKKGLKLIVRFGENKDCLISKNDQENNLFTDSNNKENKDDNSNYEDKFFNDNKDGENPDDPESPDILFCINEYRNTDNDIINMDDIKNIQFNEHKEKSIIKQLDEKKPIFLRKKKKNDKEYQLNQNMNYYKNLTKIMIKNFKHIIKKVLLDFINNKIKEEFKDNYKELLLIDNPYNVLTKKKLKDNKILFTMTIKEILESETP